MFETIGQRSDVIKSKMVAREKWKAIIISVSYNNLLIVISPLFSKIFNLGQLTLVAEVPFENRLSTLLFFLFRLGDSYAE